MTRGDPTRSSCSTTTASARRRSNKANCPRADATLKPAGAVRPGLGCGDGRERPLAGPLGRRTILARCARTCLAGGYYLVDWRGYAGYEPGDNVVHLFAMGSVATEALWPRPNALLERGIFANVIVVSSPELLFGILGRRGRLPPPAPRAWA